MLKGDSILLRPILEKDLDFLYAMHMDISNRGDYFPIGVMSESAFRKHFHEDGFWDKGEGMLVIEDKDANVVGHMEVIKTVNYLDELELSYQLYSDKYSGRGYITQAVNLTVAYIFRRMKVNRIRLVIHPENKASMRIAEKCGFTYEGIARGAWFHNGKNHDTAIYSILRDEAVQLQNPKR